MASKKTTKDEKNIEPENPETPEIVEQNIGSETEPKTDVGKLDNLLDDVVSTQQPAKDTTPEPTPEQLDTDGNIFNPSIHSTNKAGEPSLTSTGKFRMKKRPKPGELTESDIERKTVAAMSANIFIGVGVSIFGDEWKPEITKDMNEAENLTNAFDVYYAAAGVVNLPPSVILISALGMYSIKRIPKTSTKTKLKTLRFYIGERLTFWPFKNKKKKQVDHTI